MINKLLFLIVILLAVGCSKSHENDKDAVLLVTFGSTWTHGHETFDKVVEAYRQDSRFKDKDIYLAFTSKICIKRSAEGKNGPARIYLTPEEMADSILKNHRTLTIQSLHVIPGKEYGDVKDLAENLAKGDRNLNISFGRPLLATEDDIEPVADALCDIYGEYANGSVLALMGHGNPDGSKYAKANSMYTLLENELRKKGDFFVATVDMEGNTVSDLLARMGEEKRKVYLAPLLSVASDHANNDMAGDDDTSWKKQISAAGHECGDSTMIIKGLFEYERMLSIWMDHTENAELIK